MDMQNIVLGAFAALGGIGIILNYAGNYVLIAIDKSFEALLAIPKVRVFVKGNKPQLEKFIKRLSDLLIEDIQQVN